MRGAKIESLERKINRLSKQASQGLSEALFAFARTLDSKDHYTSDHTEKTVEYSLIIARALGLGEEETDRIAKASILHDLGKIGISEKILNKKTRLTPKEFKLIKKHPQIAVDIIRPVQKLHDIIPIILFHHERWDGGGYPHGLKGEEIPLGARIVSVADAYQALTSKRPYRKAFTKKAALGILKKASGTLYDPKIVDILIKTLSKKG